MTAGDTDSEPSMPDEPGYVPEADDDVFDLLCAAVGEHVDAATYQEILRTFDRFYNMRKQVRDQMQEESK